MFELSVSSARCRIFGYALKFTFIQCLLIIIVFFDGFMDAKGVILPPTLASGNSNQPTGDDFVAKRNWQSLQGAWGKRSLGAGISAEVTEADDDVYFAERRVPLPYSLGENSRPVLKYSLIYLRNGGGMLDNMLNDGDESMSNTLINEDFNKQKQFDSKMDSNNVTSNIFWNDKRAWKSMNVAWGKRRNAPQWNKFRGAWGKREPGWNNLKGMWGKRGNKEWEQLHGSLEKRSSQNIQDLN